jgi:hypothetical protein
VLLCCLVINQLSISAYIKIKPIVVLNFNARHVVKGYNKKTSQLWSTLCIDCMFELHLCSFGYCCRTICLNILVWYQNYILSWWLHGSKLNGFVIPSDESKFGNDWRSWMLWIKLLNNGMLSWTMSSYFILIYILPWQILAFI